MQAVFVPCCTNTLYSTRSISCWQTWKKKERKWLKISTAPGSRISTPSCMRCLSLMWLKAKMNDIYISIFVSLFSSKSSERVTHSCPFNIWCICPNRPWSTSPRRHVFIRTQRLWRSSSLPCCLTSSL